MRRAVYYERVSSENQKERETILMQAEDLAKRLENDPDVLVVDRYIDDGFTGAIDLKDRPEGRRLLRDAAAGRFDEVWMWKLDRIGRDDIDPLVVRRDLTRFGVKLCSLHDNIEGNLEYAVRVAIAAEERRTFFLRTAAGMARAARDGRYCGGIVPIGYKVEGKKPNARLVLSDIIMWGSWTEAEVARQIFGWTLTGWSAVKIADHMNALGIPTVYEKDGRLVRRGERKQSTDCMWRPGRILSIVKNPVYKGQYHYGRRSKKLPEPIVGEVPALVSEEAWQAAQDALARNRIMPKNTDRRYMLRSIMKCALCGLTYTAMWSHGELWYRCNGQIIYRGTKRERCPSVYLRASRLEPLIWTDVERFLRDPGDLLDELRNERHDTSAAALREAERQVAEAGLAGIPEQRNRILDLFKRGRITPTECDQQMDEIALDAEAFRAAIAALTPETVEPDDEPDMDLLDALRHRLADADEAMRQEVVSTLVRQITIKTEFVDGRKRGTAVVEYRFPGVVDTDTGTGSARRPA
ncbi:MAG: recombinase family protein [Chloroflexi bacterium]|nr:recombinase family protein [Chloroflexota bacterium]